jgi:uncharacterized protein
MRIVFDTNVIVSYFLSPTGTPAYLLAQWEQHTAPFDVIVSEAILTEYAQSLAYPQVISHHKKSEKQIDEYISLFRKLAILIDPREEVTLIKDDPDDNKFLSCALTGHAEYIVSGDRDLLDVEEYRGIHILTPRAFFTMLEQEQAA